MILQIIKSHCSIVETVFASTLSLNTVDSRDSKLRSFVARLLSSSTIRSQKRQRRDKLSTHLLCPLLQEYSYSSHDCTTIKALHLPFVSYALARSRDHYPKQQDYFSCGSLSHGTGYETSRLRWHCRDDSAYDTVQ